MSQVAQELVGTLRHVDTIDACMASACFVLTVQLYKVVLWSETRGGVDTNHCTVTGP